MTQEDTKGVREKRLEIFSSRLLLVEGQDEINLLKALIRHFMKGETGLQVIAAGGKDKFPKNLTAIKTAAQADRKLHTIGVLRDADNNPKGAFQSVCEHLRRVGYTPPKSHGTFSSGSPSIGVFILPDGHTRGAVETLCRQSVKDTDTAQCVEQYLNCLTERNAMQSNNQDKSFAHAYLAAMHNPVARVGEGALGGIWDFDSLAFQSLVCFVRSIDSPNPT